MLPDPRKYAVWPSVVPADVTVEMTITARARAFMMPEGREYTLKIIPVDGDEKDYYNPSAFEVLSAVSGSGVLKFSHCFAGEQEHLIVLMLDGKAVQEFNVYSLREDLFRLRPMLGDLHGHSYRSDGACDPAAVAGYYRSEGYDFYALTDHNRYYPGLEIDDAYRGVKTGIVRVPGEEIHTPGSSVHLIHVGGKYSVAEMYVRHTEDFEREAAAYLEKVPETVPEVFRDRYARAMWAVDKVHEAGGLMIFPHPFWKPGNSRMHNVCSSLARLFLTGGMFDAYELVGGMGQRGINESVALWNELRAEGLKLPAVGSSDIHLFSADSPLARLFTVCFAEGHDADAVIDAVRGGRCVAVETSGTRENPEYRCYGQYRLVAYAQFLLRCYFPMQRRICQGGGEAMLAYVMGEADAAQIEACACRAESFRSRFFGKEPPLLPSAEMLEFEEKWRAVQLNGPLTKGSSLVAPPVTRQI